MRAAVRGAVDSEEGGTVGVVTLADRRGRLTDCMRKGELLGMAVWSAANKRCGCWDDEEKMKGRPLN